MLSTKLKMGTFSLSNIFIPLLTSAKANSMLKNNDPKRFEYKYGKNANESSLMKQT